MNQEALDSAYEAARSWALHPVGRPPPPWARMVRSGLASWMPQWQPEARTAAPQESLEKRADCSGLLTLVAAMIAEVCQ